MKTSLRILRLLGFFAISLAIFFLAPLTGQDILHPWIYRIRIFGLIGLAIIHAIGFMWLDSQMRSLMGQWAIRILGYTWVILLLLEANFMVFDQSFGNGKVLSEKLWFDKHWGELNEQGYRDQAITTGDVEGKQKVFIVGDSFVAGHGIRKVEDRFSNRLAELLTQRIRVYNLGKGGANTQAEFKNLQNYPIEPDVLILSYFGNDIQDLLPPPKERLVLPDENLGKFTQLMYDHSFLFNFCFWKLYAPSKLMPLFFDRTDTNPIFGYLDDGILQTHFDELEQFVCYAEEREIPLIVCLFPYLSPMGMGLSAKIVCEPIERFFQDKGVEVINLYPVLRHLPAQNRMVNSMDSHPNERVNAIVADTLRTVLLKHLVDRVDNQYTP